MMVSECIGEYDDNEKEYNIKEDLCTVGALVSEILTAGTYGTIKLQHDATSKCSNISMKFEYKNENLLKKIPECLMSATVIDAYSGGTYDLMDYYLIFKCSGTDCDNCPM